MLYIKTIYKLFPIFLIHNSVQGAQNNPVIAVVGAGIGGTSVSYFLKDLFGDEKIDIDIYEANKIGGRLATIDVDGQQYETGGSVIHPDNRYMAHFCKKFDLQKKEIGDTLKVFGLYDGKEVVFTESQYHIVTLLKMLWRYGLNPLTLSNHVEKMLSKFKRIYELQDRGMSFPTVKGLLKNMSPDFLEDVKISSAEGFSKLGLSNRTISELIMAGLMVNYGQTTTAHKFVGSVSSAAGDGHLWSIMGGNKLVPEKLLKYSGANLINENVEIISLNKKSGQYHVSYSLDVDPVNEETKVDNNSKMNNTVTKVYDIVIIATPLTSDTSNIIFENLPSVIVVPKGRYHRTVCTIVKGELNLKYFGENNVANEIYSIKNGLRINSVGRIQTVNTRSEKEDSKVWKVFSQDLLSENDLSAMFLQLDEVNVVDWLAYPHYDSKQKLGSFVLEKNLYHVNAIEWAASAMEMSVIGAKNVALLAYKDWTGVSVGRIKKDEL